MRSLFEPCRDACDVLQAAHKSLPRACGEPPAANGDSSIDISE